MFSKPYMLKPLAVVDKLFIQMTKFHLALSKFVFKSCQSISDTQMEESHG